MIENAGIPALTGTKSASLIPQEWKFEVDIHGVKMSFALTYGATAGEQNEEEVRNYHSRVAFGFFLLALLGFACRMYGDLPEEAGYLWLATVLVAFPSVRLLEDVLQERFVGHDGETETPSGTLDSDGGDSGDGTLEHFLKTADAARFRRLDEVRTPEGRFDHLLLTKDGGMVAVLRGAHDQPIGSSDDGTLVDASGREVDMQAIEQFHKDIYRVWQVVQPIPGQQPRVSGIYLVPDGSFNHAIVSDEAFHLVPESHFRYALDELCKGIGLNKVIWENTTHLRSLIRG